METIAKYENLRIPNWALSYLINSDDSGLEPENKKLVDNYMKFYEDLAEKHDASIIFSIETNLEEYKEAEDRLTDCIEFDLTYDKEEIDIVSDNKRLLQQVMDLRKIRDEWKEPYFSHGPEFGLGCDVVECTILIVK